MSLYQSVDDYHEAHHKQPGGAAARVQEVLDQLNGLGRRLDAVRFLDEGFAHEQAEQLAADDHGHILDHVTCGFLLRGQFVFQHTHAAAPISPEKTSFRAAIRPGRSNLAT